MGELHTAVGLHIAIAGRQAGVKTRQTDDEKAHEQAGIKELNIVDVHKVMGDALSDTPSAWPEL